MWCETAKGDAKYICFGAHTLMDSRSTELGSQRWVWCSEPNFITLTTIDFLTILNIVKKLQLKMTKTMKSRILETAEMLRRWDKCWDVSSVDLLPIIVCAPNHLASLLAVSHQIWVPYVSIVGFWRKWLSVLSLMLRAELHHFDYNWLFDMPERCKEISTQNDQNHER